jgi:hypothetical protein
MAGGRKEDPAKSFGFKSKSKRQRKGETRAEFFLRVTKTFPEVIIGVKANIELAAAVYDLDVKLLRAMIAQEVDKNGKRSNRCQQAYVRARNIASARKNDEEKAAELMEEVARGEFTGKDMRLIRKNWPVDPDERESAIKDALLISLVENHGNVAESSNCLNLPIHEIMKMLKADDELQAAKNDGMDVAVLLAEASVIEGAKAGNTTLAKMLLTNKDSDNWSEKQSISVKHEGFRPPTDDEVSSGGVLSLVTGGKK